MQIEEVGKYKPRYSTPEFSFTVMGAPIISWRNPEGSEVLPVGGVVGPFSVMLLSLWLVMGEIRVMLRGVR